MRPRRCCCRRTCSPCCQSRSSGANWKTKQLVVQYGDCGCSRRVVAAYFNQDARTRHRMTSKLLHYMKRTNPQRKFVFGLVATAMLIA